MTRVQRKPQRQRAIDQPEHAHLRVWRACFGDPERRALLARVADADDATLDRVRRALDGEAEPHA